MLKFILLMLIISALSLQSPLQDLVNPFQQIPYNNSKWYSGYLNIPSGKYHYVFFQSQYNPDNDPILLWLNGGPGCSSMIGMLLQNGPFVYQRNQTQLSSNQYAWNQKANLLYIQSPGKVGYSVTNRTYNSDATSAQDHLSALLSFYIKFPTLRKNQFYVSGQSYGGVYIPWLAWKIYQHNDLLSSRNTIINIKGIIIGNGCIDPLDCAAPGKYGLSIYQYEFFYYHGYYTTEQINQFRGVCLLDYNSTQCQTIRVRLEQFFDSTLTDASNIYEKCYYNSSVNFKFELNQYDLVKQLKKDQKILKRKIRPNGWKQLVLNQQVDCDDSSGLLDFFNKHGNFERLHVDGSIKFQQCNDEVFDTFHTFLNGSIWIFPQLIKRDLRIWIYSGDVDGLVPIGGTIAWIMKFRQQQGLSTIQPWRQWWVKGLHKNQDQVGGMTWRLRGITFASVKNAGHQVPRDKRKQAYTLISSFLNGKPLPYKNQQ